MMINNPRPSASTESRPAAPSAQRPQPTHPRADRQPANEGQRNRFETLLSRHEAEAEEGDDGNLGEEASAWGLLSQGRQPWPPGQRGSGMAQGEDDGTVDPDASVLPGSDVPVGTRLPAPVPDIQVPAPVFPVAEPQQTRLYAHMALPLTPGSGAGRFEVLDPSGASMVSHVELNTVPQGGLTVAIGTSVHNAALMDRHLPQLQRRLAGRVSAHLRVQESDAERD